VNVPAFAPGRRSSVVEHTLGKGGVVISIITGGTSEPLVPITLFGYPLPLDREQMELAQDRTEQESGGKVGGVVPFPFTRPGLDSSPWTARKTGSGRSASRCARRSRPLEVAIR